MWSNGDGTIGDPNAPETTYTCAEIGDHEITISDDDFEFCIDSWTVLVTGVKGDGDMCESNAECDDTNDCTINICDEGTCASENVGAGDVTKTKTSAPRPLARPTSAARSTCPMARRATAATVNARRECASA